ncbi:hypothetical protein GCM10017786_50100 [Amycolatopsis deserti]|uniref:Uncharacterized protein n=1 Tax=Amycolatopsis deserti TaxID=185696 RepID=A0ABQ3JCH5_9PSEU|nr:hypothetical protein [Amycolatopsis deserti]GHF10407.1 hypothetical protein GCM10017786_50100 [Amycolatopsis deserti]
MHIMLRSAFADAVTWKYVSTNPVAAVTAPPLESRDDLYTADIPALDRAAAQEISNLFRGSPGFGTDAMEVTLEAA